MTKPSAEVLPSDRHAALGIVVVAALLWSTSGFFAKAPYFAEWSGPMLAFWRAAFASVFLLPLVRQPKWSWRLLPMILAFAGMNYAYLTAMKLGTAANAIWLQNTAPVWVLLAGVFLLREHATRRDVWMVVLGAIGVGFILCFEFRDLQAKPTAAAATSWALVSGLLYAGVVLSLRMLRDHDAVWLIALNHLCTVLLLPVMIYVPVVIAGETLPPFAVPTGIQWPLVAAFGILQMGLPYVLFSRALRTIPGHEATAITLIEPILVPIGPGWRGANGLRGGRSSVRRSSLPDSPCVICRCRNGVGSNSYFDSAFRKSSTSSTLRGSTRYFVSFFRRSRSARSSAAQAAVSSFFPFVRLIPFPAKSNHG